MSRTSRRLVAGTVVAIVVGASLVPLGPGGADVAVPVSDLLWHVVGYAAVAVSVARATGRPWTAAGFAVALGVAVEFLQIPVPTRHFAPSDVAADVVGAALGVVVFRLRSSSRTPE